MEINVQLTSQLVLSPAALPADPGVDVLPMVVVVVVVVVLVASGAGERARVA